MPTKLISLPLALGAAWWSTGAAAQFAYDYDAHRCLDASGAEGRNSGFVECGAASGRSGEVSLANLIIPGSVWTEMALARCTDSVDLTHCELGHAPGENGFVVSTFENSDLSGLQVSKSSLAGAMLRNSRLDDAVVSEVRLGRAAKDLLVDVRCRQQAESHARGSFFRFGPGRAA